MQAPASQVSVVQALASSQSAAVAQRWQPGMTESWQLPSVPQASVVQGFWSVQSAAAVHGTQPGMGACAHTPASQLSVVQPLASLQSAAVSQRWLPGMAESWQLP